MELPPSELATPTRVVIVRPTSVPPTLTPRPMPTPTPQLVSRLEIAQAAVQFWSDPNDVSSLAHDGQYLWAATSGGIVRWDASGGNRLFTTDDGLASLAVQGMAADGDGHLWVGYADVEGWSEYDGEAWATYETREDAVERRYQAMLAARAFEPQMWVSRPDSDWVWLAAADGRLEAYDGVRWRIYGRYEGVTGNTWLVDISVDGRVWAVGNGLSTAQEGERWWTDHDLFSEISDRQQVTDITVDDEGRLWLAFTGSREGEGGVCRLEHDTMRWVGYLHAVEPTIPETVYQVNVEADGSVWLAGAGGITYQQPGRPWTLLPWDGATVQAYVKDATGRLWLGTRRGVGWLDDDLSQAHGPYLVPSPLFGSRVQALVRDGQGRTYLGMTSGLGFFDAEGETGVITSEEPLCMVLGPDGYLWYTTSSGLYALGEHDTPHQATGAALVAMTFDGDGALWACTGGGDIVKGVGAGQETVANIIQLSGALPRSMVVDSQGTIWFAQSVGVGSLAADGTWQLYTKEDRLLSNDVRDVALGPEDTLWFATEFGLARRRPDGRWTRFTSESTEGGLRSLEMYDVWAEADGTLWMTTAQGVSRRTTEADWSYYDIPDARAVLPESQDVVWVGNPNGLYRLRVEAMTVIPD